MRRRITENRVLASAACSLLAAGCQITPGSSRSLLGSIATGGEYVCASDLGFIAPKEAAAAPPSAETQPTTTRPAPKPPYTVPGSQFQQMSFVALTGAAVGATEGLFDAKGRELAENPSLQPVSLGRPILAPALRGGTTFQAVGRRGLLRGRAGLLRGSPVNNLFTPRANPVSAHCQELVRAGFFRNSAACRDYFRR